MPLGRPGAFILVPWGTTLAASGHLCGPRQPQKGHLGVRSRNFAEFEYISGPNVESLPGTLEYVFVLASRLVLQRFSGLSLVTWSLKKQVCG